MQPLTTNAPVGNDVRVLSVGDVPLSVNEPSGNLELSRVLHDGDNALKLVRVKLSGARCRFKEKVSNETLILYEAEAAQVYVNIAGASARPNQQANPPFSLIHNVPSSTEPTALFHPFARNLLHPCKTSSADCKRVSGRTAS